MNKIISYIKKHPFLGVAVVFIGGVFICIECGRRLLNSRGCGISVAECYMTIGTFISAVATACMAWIAYEGNKQNEENAKIAKASADAAQKQADAAIQSLQEAQKQREEEYRPRLVVYFVGDPKDAFGDLIIENIGKTSAYNAEISCDSFVFLKEKPRKRSYFPPGRKEILERRYLNFGDRSITNHKKLHLKLRYTDHNKKQFEESVEVFFSNLWSL